VNVLLPYLYVGLGGALGSVARFGLNGLISQKFEKFPAGTLFVNVTGSFLIGFIAALSAPEGRFWIAPKGREFLMIGILGGYTTFSSFSLQTLNLARDGQMLYAGMNIVLSVFLCLLGVWLGNVFGQYVNR
jgi:fluoride exporter